MKPLGFSLDEMKAVMTDIETLADPDVAEDAGSAARLRLVVTQQDASRRREKIVAQLAMADEFIDLVSARLG